MVAAVTKAELCPETLSTHYWRDQDTERDRERKRERERHRERGIDRESRGKQRGMFRTHTPNEAFDLIHQIPAITTLEHLRAILRYLRIYSVLSDGARNINYALRSKILQSLGSQTSLQSG
jgi:hypothetical protein